MTSEKFIYMAVESSGKTVYRISWDNNPVDRRVYDRIVDWVRKSTDYSAMTAHRLSKFNTLLIELRKEFDSDITLSQGISIRNTVIKEKIIKNYSRMNRMISKIAEEYNNGRCILVLSSKYDFPPLNLLRGILINRGLPQGEIYKVFANKFDPKTLLSGRDLYQFYLAEKHDAESAFNRQQIAETAAENEARVIAYFKSIGCNIKTQDDLVREQVETHGRAILTPDLLFLDEVYINGTRVHWIDYKDYIGTDIRFLLKSNIDQAAKYTEKWGTGALCFHKSYVDGLFIPNSILLDASALPISLK